MNYVFDTHVHIYPFYDLEMALGAIDSNLLKLESAGTRVACLTERYDCHIFDDLLASSGRTGGGGFNMTPSSSCNSIRIENAHSGTDFHLLPGQQIITGENLEILSLNCRGRVQEGLPAADTIREVLALGGIPVAAWAVGKWFTKRGKIIASLIEQFSPSELAVGDTTMRPRGWLTPLLMRKAVKAGLRVVCGSDPLPFSGEEIRPGSYASRLTLDGKTLHPEEAIRYILMPEAEMHPAGSRGSIFEVLSRLYNHSKSH